MKKIVVVVLIPALAAFIIGQTALTMRPAIETIELKPGTSVEVGDVRVTEDKGVVTVETLGPPETETITIKEGEQIDVPRACRYIVPRGVSVKIGKTSLGLRTTVQNDGGYLYEFFAPVEEIK